VIEAKQVPNGLDELERDPRSGEVTRTARGVEFGIGDSHINRHSLPGLMVIGYNHIDARRLKLGDFLRRRHATVHGDDERRRSSHQPLNRLSGKPVSFSKPVWHRGSHLCTQRAKPACGDGRRRDPIEVEVAEYDDALTLTHRTRYTLSRLHHSRNVQGIIPITSKVGLQKAPRILTIGDMARDEDARNDR
jgi:hypothetical protein